MSARWSRAKAYFNNESNYIYSMYVCLSERCHNFSIEGTHPLSRPIRPTDPGRTTRIRETKLPTKRCHILHFCPLCLMMSNLPSKLPCQWANFTTPSREKVVDCWAKIPKRFPRNLFCFGVFVLLLLITVMSLSTRSLTDDRFINLCSRQFFKVSHKQRKWDYTYLRYLMPYASQRRVIEPDKIWYLSATWLITWTKLVKRLGSSSIVGWSN